MDFIIKDKIIKLDKASLGGKKIVSYNTGYKVNFIFDSEWDNVTKTVRFVNEDIVKDVVLGEDCGCEIPIEVLRSSGTLEVGVFGGSIQTTTTAKVKILASVLEGTYEVSSPEEGSHYVESVNGMQGFVVLTAEDIGAVSKAELQSVINSALAQAKESGDFKGEPGKDGYTPVKGVDYFDGEPGKDGEPGPQGEPGKDGYTPVKGVDYFDGEPGPQGEPGKDGEPGPQGEPGKDGEPGPQGEPGKDGYTPVKGVDYFDGEPGKDGYTPVKGVDYFDGEPGPQGEPGKDGYTPVKGVDYFDGEPGKDGEPGPQGEPGKDGYTPVKGVDYYTEEDKSELLDELANSIPETGGGTFKVNCELDPESLSAINLDKTFEEINAAFDEGYSVILVVDLSSIGEQSSSIFPLATKGTENSNFFGQMYMGVVYFVMVTVYSSGSTQTTMIPLTTEGS